MITHPYTPRTTLVILFMTLSLGFLQVLGAATVSGHVTDTATNGPLPGANVFLEGTSFGAASDRTGDYSIANVPPGTYSLQVSYIGYEDYSAEIVVSADNEAVSHDVAMTASFVEMEAVEISGIRIGQAKALNQQRTANNIMNVVAEEQIQSFPDVNSAEVLQRVPGVAIERDQGEGRYVIIRGMSSGLNAMSVNGEHIPSPEGYGREVALDIIPADQLASIEVTKAITPDMDADALGGSVNLVTKSALDYDHRVLKATLGGGYNDLMGTSLLNGHFTFGDRFGADRNIGAMISFSYSQNNLGSDNIEIEWDSIDLGEDEDGAEVPWALNDLQIRDYEITRNRMGLSANVDYEMDTNNKFFVRALWNKLDDLEARRRLRYRPSKGWYNTATDVREGAIERSLKDRWQNQTIYNLTFGGEHILSNLALDYRLAYSYGEEEEADYFGSDFELNEDADMTLDVSDPDLPKVTVTGLAAGYQFDPANYEFDGLEVANNITTNTDITATLNASYPFMLAGNQATAKFGGKFLTKTKDRDEHVMAYDWEGDALMMDAVAGSFEDDDFMGGEYEVGPTQGTDELRDFFDQYKDMETGFMGEEDPEATYVADYDATETVIAFYGMATVNMGALTVIAGLRDEITTTEYTGYEVEFDTVGDFSGYTEATEKNDQNHFLPSVHLKYQLDPVTNIRASFTSGLARAPYETLVPYMLIVQEDEELEIGNPDLIPTTAYSVDLLGERYMRGIGLVAGGFFFKTLDNIIFEHVYDIDDANDPYDGWEVTQPIQGETATLLGVELNWQQQMTSLPAPWDGLGIYVNYTHTTSTADISGQFPDREDNDELPLPGQAGNVGNFAVSYQKFGITSRLSLNYNDGFLFTIGDDDTEDIYQASHLQLDFSTSYQILSNLQVYVQANNLTDAPLVYYMGEENRPVQREFYSYWINAGLKLEF